MENYYRIEIRDIGSGERVAARQVSADSGFYLRESLAKKEIESLGGKPEDFYVAEYEIYEGVESLINKYQV